MARVEEPHRGERMRVWKKVGRVVVRKVWRVEIGGFV